MVVGNRDGGLPRTHPEENQEGLGHFEPLAEELGPWLSAAFWCQIEEKEGERKRKPGARGPGSGDRKAPHLGNLARHAAIRGQVVELVKGGFQTNLAVRDGLQGRHQSRFGLFWHGVALVEGQHGVVRLG